MPRSRSHPVARVRRVARALVSPIQRILAIEAASGIFLMIATIAALAWANLAPGSYATTWSHEARVELGAWAPAASLQLVVNDGLMTIFFFVVGLEIRREIADGELASLKQAALPIAAALGGMLVPAGVFAILNTGRAGSAGWGVPMATDIAFAVGVLTLLGSRVPSAQRVLLLSLAVIDDIGAIVVIAVFYSAGLAPGGVVIVGLGIAAVIALRVARVRVALAYVIPGIAVWYGLHVVGIHPTLAGVILGMLTPVATLTGEDASPSERLSRVLHPWVAYVVMPVFALANAGIELASPSLAGDAWWLFVGIVLGLACGKPIGIAVASLVTTKVGLAARSADLHARGIVLVGLVGGIGFTMSLFIAQLAFPSGPLLDTAKLAILVGSAASMVLGLGFGAMSLRRPPA